MEGLVTLLSWGAFILAAAGFLFALAAAFSARRSVKQLQAAVPKNTMRLEGDKFVSATTVEEPRTAVVSRDGGVVEAYVRLDTELAREEILLSDCSKVVYSSLMESWILFKDSSYHIIDNANIGTVSELLTKMFGEPEKQPANEAVIWRNRPGREQVEFLDMDEGEAASLFMEGFLAWPEPDAVPGDRERAVMVPWGIPLAEAQQLGVIRRETGKGDELLPTVSLVLNCPVQVGNVLVTGYMDSIAVLGDPFPGRPVNGLHIRIFSAENGERDIRRAVDSVKLLHGGGKDGTMVDTSGAEEGELHTSVRFASPDRPEASFGFGFFPIFRQFADCAVLMLDAGIAGAGEEPSATPFYRGGPLVEADAKVHSLPFDWKLYESAGIYVKDAPQIAELVEEGARACFWHNPRAGEVGIASFAPESGWRALAVPLDITDGFSLFLHTKEGEETVFFAVLRHEESLALATTVDGLALRAAAPLLAELSGQTVTIVLLPEK